MDEGERFENLKKLKEHVQPKGLKSDHGKQIIGTTRLMTRIVIYLQEICPRANITTIGRGIVGSKTRLPDTMLWLVNNGIVLKEKVPNSNAKKTNSCWNMYRLNPEWVKIKEARYR